MTATARRVKAIAERTLGVHISRTPPAPPGKHADGAIQQIRRWSSRDVVFDVGANDGRTVLRLQELLARPRIFAFEPVSSTYRTLVQRTSQLPNVRTFPLALGAEPGEQTIYLNAMDSMNSFHQGWSSEPAGTETVQISTVDEVMTREGVDFVHLLKVDTEGYELEVLQGAERALRASRIAIVQLEVGVEQMAKRFLTLEEARQHLAERGYRLQGIYNQCLTRANTPKEWSGEVSDGYRPDVLAYVDALFIRADL